VQLYAYLLNLARWHRCQQYGCSDFAEELFVGVACAGHGAAPLRGVL
jgi:hypothetical protein